jgi:glycosyltransferase involved in cell wall biosynthesis
MTEHDFGNVAPRFSVILISYNQHDYLEAAAASVLEGCVGTSLELICVDDESSDGTADVIKRLVTQDLRVRAVHLAHTGKPSIARNAGLQSAKGEYVCFLDGDDLYDVRKMALLDAAICAVPGADVIFHDYVDFPDGEIPFGRPPRIQGQAEEARLLSLATAQHQLDFGVEAVELESRGLAEMLVADAFLINTSTICIRREHASSIGARFPEDRVVGEDNVFWLGCVLHSSAVYMKAPLSYWRKHPRSLTHQPNPQRQRELVRSMREMTAMLGDRISSGGAARAQRRLLEESNHIGWLLETEGRWIAASGTYARSAFEFGSWRAMYLAAKAVARAVLAAVRITTR